MTTYLPPPPEYPGKEAIPSSPTSRLRSIDIRTWLLTFAALCVFSDLNEVLVSIAYYGFSSKSTIALLVDTALDLILLHAALTNEIFSLKINRAIASFLMYTSLFAFIFMIHASSAIIFGFYEFENHLFKETNEKPTYGEQVGDALVLTSIIGALFSILFVRDYLVKNTLRKVQMEMNLELLPMRTI